MSDLISRADAIDAIEAETRCTDRGEDVSGLTLAKSLIDALPSADRPSGEWEEMEILCNPYPPLFCVECSECGYRVGRETYLDLENTFNFCPNCGAYMRKKNNEQR